MKLSVATSSVLALFFSQRGRRLRRLGQTPGEGAPPTRQLHCPPDGLPRGAHHGSPGAQKL